MIQTITTKDVEKIKTIKQRSTADFDLVLTRVKPIIERVKVFKDQALIEFSKKYDSATISKNTLQVRQQEIKEAYKRVSPELVKALKQAAENIKQYSKLQLPKEWRKTNKGVEVGQLVRPLDKVGCYVPGGKFQLPSSVLMTVIPAKVAGVKEVIICTPPRANNYAILVAADIAGADKIFRVGGAQSIAAMAYGTESIPKVDKIVGPGNIFVTAAKKLVYGDVGIDFIAGPSEILIFAEKGNPKFIAADMLSQAEHDRLASSIFVTTDKTLAKKVNLEINKQVNQLKSNDVIAKASLRKYGAIILANNVNDAFKFINDFAPEHLEIMSNKKELVKKVSNAGAVFFGEYTCEAAGDYASGPNHVLPTAQAAKFRAGLSTLDFVKMPTYQSITKQGLASLRKTITKIAEVEGLEAHKNSVEVRFK